MAASHLCRILRLTRPPRLHARSEALRRGSPNLGAVFRCAHLWRGLVLQLKQLEVNAAAGEKLLMASGFAQLSFVEHEDLVHILNRRQIGRASCRERVE